MDGSAEISETRPADTTDDLPRRDAAMARRIASGDVAAWGAFFDQYSPWAYRFACWHLNGNHADAEDLCSDILTTAAQAIKGFDPRRGTLDVWLLGLARRRLAHFCRRHRRECPLVPDLDSSEPNRETSLSDPWEEASDQRDSVNRALASLPQRQAAALIGKYVTGFSVEELAGHMQSTPKAVESLLSRARAGFRSAFQALHDSGSGGKNRD